MCDVACGTLLYVSEKMNYEIQEGKVMWTINGVKERGRNAFRANYWNCVLVALIMGILLGVFTGTAGTAGGGTESMESVEQVSEAVSSVNLAVVISTAVGISFAGALYLLFKIFIQNPIEVGGHVFFRNNLYGSAPVTDLKIGFSNYGKTFGTLLLRDVYLFLWMLLLLIPGIVKSYSYCMVPYILAEHPELSANEIITRSREMMNGNKWRAFVLDLSFIGWEILSVLSLGIVHIFWTSPYMHSTHAALYEELKKEKRM